MGKSNSLFYRMSNIIYTQKSQWECIRYAFLNALQLSGVKITEQEILAMEPMLWFPWMERNLKELWIIKWLEYPKNISTINWLLKRWNKLPCLIYRNNFESVKKAPYLQDFGGKMQHFVCIVEDCGDRFKVVDQQGENFWDKWYWYILKTDFTKIKVARICFA